MPMFFPMWMVLASEIFIIGLKKSPWGAVILVEGYDHWVCRSGCFSHYDLHLVYNTSWHWSTCPDCVDVQPSTNSLNDTFTVSGKSLMWHRDIFQIFKQVFKGCQQKFWNVSMKIQWKILVGVIKYD